METLQKALLSLCSEDGLTDEEAEALGKKVGIDWELVEFSVAQFKRGYAEEFVEHGTVDPETNITDDSPEMTAKIAWTHLKKNPAYYDKEVEKEALFPQTDPVINQGDAPQEDFPQTDSRLYPRWVGKKELDDLCK